MHRRGISRKLAGMAAAIALCATPTIAHASTAASAQSISPLVALSVFGTQASAQAVCGTASTAAAGTAAATAAQTPPGCVLPAVDAPPPPVGETPPISPAASPRGFGISPILLGLIGIAALAALIAAGNDGGDNEPESP